MAYAVLADFKSRLGTSVTPPGLYEQLTDRTGASVADDVVGQEILDSAHGQLDAYMAKRYKVPVDVSTDATLAAFLKDAVLILAEYRGWQAHPKRREIPDRISDALRNITSLLNRIADGKAALPGSAPVAETNTAGITGEAFGHTQQFTEEGMQGL